METMVDQCIENIYPIIFGNITMDSPSPAFLDITKNTKEWDGDIYSYLLLRLQSTTNKHLKPTVKCPWGCS